MEPLEKIKQQVKTLYETAPEIHMDVALSRPRLTLQNAAATITGVYPHIFQITESSSGAPKSHTLQYTDILIGSIKIVELEK